MPGTGPGRQKNEILRRSSNGNCLGHRNHKYFLMFLFIYAVFLIVMFAETTRHFAEVFSHIGFTCFKTDTVTTILMIGIWLHMPILIW